jgi:hypothetical protein
MVTDQLLAQQMAADQLLAQQLAADQLLAQQLAAHEPATEQGNVQYGDYVSRANARPALVSSLTP